MASFINAMDAAGSGAVVTSNPSGITGSRLFLVRYALELPIYVIGCVLNVYVIYKFLRNNRKNYEASRMNRIITCLLGACLAWSVVSCIRYASWLGEAGNNLVLLTIEAFVGMGYFTLVGLILGVYSFIMLGVYATSSSNDSVLPDKELQASIWIWSTALYYTATIVAIIALYISTFFHTRNVLRMHIQTYSTSAAEMLIRKRAILEIERKVLFYSICFGFIVVICYLPEILMNGVVVAGLVNPDTQTDLLEIWKCVANVFVACDTVVTPLLVVFVGPKEVRDDSALEM
ncbi:hypothetical protein BCR33DRAFT_770667 [Rhizoclosmatium globosum]|uniref:G-protein coupled receptors family 1 profile domain-containing protein n=1 Tax=Rhizoclosmatium globosum TaxID=329046 RepID=A0A1Y2BM20_9FUNG|nr:hypothetical protein BCR33DRAFT_770667 [Rhizoclosmatium globosum]|eukprot:ORY35205.1 hypothetical protein BCR33DRAFT_770667 [Rhizoclosmatium globosum]